MPTELLLASRHRACFGCAGIPTLRGNPQACVRRKSVPFQSRMKDAINGGGQTTLGHEASHRPPRNGPAQFKRVNHLTLNAVLAGLPLARRPRAHDGRAGGSRLAAPCDVSKLFAEECLR